MAEVTIQALRNHAEAVADRVVQGEQVMITRAGQRVAELRPIPRPPLKAETLLARWRRLPHVDYQAMQADIDEIIDPAR
jgi:prevent-host-death family protein